jgi:hypothetical protein
MWHVAIYSTKIFLYKNFWHIMNREVRPLENAAACTGRLTYLAKETPEVATVSTTGEFDAVPVLTYTVNRKFLIEISKTQILLLANETDTCFNYK